MSVRTVADVERALGDAGVPTLVFKGPVLASLLYREGGLRSYGDVDILVPRRRFADAVLTLEAAGFGTRSRTGK